MAKNRGMKENCHPDFPFYLTIRYIFFTFNLMYSLEKITLKDVLAPIQSELDQFEKAYSTYFQTDIPYIKPLLEYIGENQGKRLRPVLYYLSNGLTNAFSNRDHSIPILLELLHTATLIHDDVVDGSMERRQNKTMNALWGDKVSVLLGDYLFAKVLSIGVSTNKPRVLDIISNVVIQIGQGELRQMLDHSSQSENKEAYFQLVRDKTASLFAAACELGTLDAAPSIQEKIRKVGELYGIAFQIRDDILDYTGDDDILGKPSGQDVINGKMTLPLIMALESADLEDKSRILDILNQESENHKEQLYQFIVKMTGIDKAQKMAQEVSNQALDLIITFSPSQYRESLEKMIHHNLVRVK